MNMTQLLDSKPINVLFILNSLCVGGAEKQVVSLINRIDTTRHAVSLLYLKQEDALLGQIEPSSCVDGIRCLGVKRGVEWPAVRELARHMDEKRIDVVVCTNMYALLYGWLARRQSHRRKEIKLIEVFHTTEVASRKEQLSMLLYRSLVRRTELLVYVCNGQATHWQRYGLRPRQEAVIYNGIDTGHFVDVWSGEEKLALRARHGFRADDYVVGLCAVMRPEKAHEDLLIAMALLGEKGVGIKCLLIGDGPERAFIERRIAELGLGDHVHITGFLQDVRAAIAACDVMVLPSRETFSLAALEAMALGKPMVMTRIGGAAEQVREGVDGLLYPAGDTAALAASLAKLSDRALRVTAGSKASANVRDVFDVSRMVKGYERAFADLVIGNPVQSSASARFGSTYAATRR